MTEINVEPVKLVHTNTIPEKVFVIFALLTPIQTLSRLLQRMIACHARLKYYRWQRANKISTLFASQVTQEPTALRVVQEHIRRKLVLASVLIAMRVHTLPLRLQHQKIRAYTAKGTPPRSQEVVLMMTVCVILVIMIR